MGYAIADGITQSLLAKWLSCRVRGGFYINGWRKDEARRDALDFGNLFHLALEHYYGKLPGDVVGIWRDKCKSEGPVNPQDLELIEMQFEVCWPAYLKVYSKQDAKLAWKGRLEEKFDVQWRGFRLRGKIDGIPEVARKLWIFETKTKSQIDEDGLTQQLEMDLQNQMYITALQQKKERPVGVIYNVVRRPGIKFNPDKPKEYVAKIAEDIGERPEHYFKRFEVTYTDKQLTIFQDELFAAATEFKMWNEGKLATYKNTQSCVGRGRCEYLQMCSSANSPIGYNQNGKLFKELE